MGCRRWGHYPVAWSQFMGATFLSAILDNNIVADFASRGLHNLDLPTLHLFAMSQIAGYALGGCWTHIGCAQSVVAYAFICRDVDERYTPVQWIREMTPVILEMLVVISVLIYAESKLLSLLSTKNQAPEGRRPRITARRGRAPPSCPATGSRPIARGQIKMNTEIRTISMMK